MWRYLYTSLRSMTKAVEPFYLLLCNSQLGGASYFLRIAHKY